MYLMCKLNLKQWLNGNKSGIKLTRSFLITCVSFSFSVFNEFDLYIVLFIVFSVDNQTDHRQQVQREYGPQTRANAPDSNLRLGLRCEIMYHFKVGHITAWLLHASVCKLYTILFVTEVV